MTNQAHHIVVPGAEASMAMALGRAHMRYARWLNKKRGWRGHLDALVNTAMREQDVKMLLRITSTGRPTGDDRFVADMEAWLERILKRQKPGPKIGRPILKASLPIWLENCCNGARTK